MIKSLQFMDLHAALAAIGNTAFIDAAPFYTGLRVKLTFSGSDSRDSGNYTINLSGVIEKTFTRVDIPIETDPLGGAFTHDQWTSSRPYAGNPPADSFWLWLAYPGINYRGVSSREQAMRFFPNYFHFDAEVVGSWSDTSAGTSGDAEAEFDFTAPVAGTSDPGLGTYERGVWQRYGVAFTGSTADITAGPYSYNLPLWTDSPSGGINISGWTQSDWRDQRGIYSMTFTDPGSSLQVEVEWEIF